MNEESMKHWSVGKDGNGKYEFGLNPLMRVVSYCFLCYFLLIDNSTKIGDLWLEADLYKFNNDHLPAHFITEKRHTLHYPVTGCVVKFVIMMRSLCTFSH